MCVGMLLRRDISLGQNSEKSLKNKMFMEPNGSTFTNERAHFFPFEVGWG
jgi:hypothetical protein